MTTSQHKLMDSGYKNINGLTNIFFVISKLCPRLYHTLLP